LEFGSDRGHSGPGQESLEKRSGGPTVKKLDALRSTLSPKGPTPLAWPVAVLSKLAIVMHRMWRTGEPARFGKADVDPVIS